MVWLRFKMSKIVDTILRAEVCRCAMHQVIPYGCQVYCSLHKRKSLVFHMGYGVQRVKAVLPEFFFLSHRPWKLFSDGFPSAPIKDYIASCIYGLFYQWIAHASNGMMILGIDAENVKRLKEGKPILKSLAQFGGTDDILIIYGETLDDVQRQLESVMGPLPAAQSNPHLDD